MKIWSLQFLLATAFVALLIGVAAADEVVQFEQYRHQMLAPLQERYDALQSTHQASASWRTYSARLAVIDTITDLIVRGFDAAKTSSLDAMLTGVVALPNTPQRKKEAISARSIFTQYEDALREPLPRLPIADEELALLREYYDHYTRTATAFVAERGQMYIHLNRQPTAEIVELCLVMLMLHVSDDDWNYDTAQQIPDWILTGVYLPMCEKFALNVRRYRTAWVFHRRLRNLVAGVDENQAYVDYLIEAGQSRKRSKDYPTAYQCLDTALQLKEAANDREAAYGLRFDLAEMLSITSHSQIAANLLQPVLASPRNDLECGKAAMLRLKYLYEASMFDPLITEGLRHEKDPRCRPYLPQILYITWVACRRENRINDANRLQDEFLQRFERHPLAADIYFAQAMTALASANYDEASRLLEIIEFRFPDSRLLTPAKDIRGRLKRLENQNTVDEPKQQ